MLLCFAVMGMVAFRASQPPVRHGGAEEAWIHALTIGDARYALLAVTVAGAWLLARAWPGNAGELAASLVLFQPRTLFVLEQGWIAPVAFFCFALAVFAISRCAHLALLGAALALLAVTTPLSLFLVVPLAFAVPRWRALFAGGAAVIAVVAAAFWLSSSSQDAGALSLAPLVPMPWIRGAVLGAALLLFCLRRRIDLAPACAAAGASVAAVLLFSPDSFADAWWRRRLLPQRARFPRPAPRRLSRAVRRKRSPQPPERGRHRRLRTLAQSVLQRHVIAASKATAPALPTA